MIERNEYKLTKREKKLSTKDVCPMRMMGRVDRRISEVVVVFVVFQRIQFVIWRELAALRSHRHRQDLEKTKGHDLPKPF